MAKPNLTVVYYTNNREHPEFARRIQQTLWRTIKPMRLPLISVSQQPLAFGENICVGNVGSCYHNVYRQMQVGILAARTKYVCVAEADFLHPPEYFRFRPPRDDTFYLSYPLYVLIALRGRRRCYVPKHKGHDCSMVTTRDCALRAFDLMLANTPEWREEGSSGAGYRNVTRYGHCVHFTTEIASVTFKTEQNMHRKFPARWKSRVDTLPYWGNARSLLRTYGM